MQENILIEQNDNKEISVAPDIIFNRFDLCEDYEYLDLIIKSDQDRRVLVRTANSTAYLGCFLMDISIEEISALIKYVFENFSNIKCIRCENGINPFGAYKENAQRIIDLPNSEEALHQRLSKKGRYNLKREKRIVQEEIGEYSFIHYTSEDVPADIMQAFFDYKMVTHKRKYNINPLEYIKKEHVTDIYVIKTQSELLAVALSCEQCGETYFENFSYNPTYSHYSLGSIIYDLYLCELIKKGKTRVYLGSDLYEYKKRYDSVSEMAYICEIYRSSVITKLVHIIKIVYRFFYRKIVKYKS